MILTGQKVAPITIVVVTLAANETKSSDTINQKPAGDDIPTLKTELTLTYD